MRNNLWNIGTVCVFAAAVGAASPIASAVLITCEDQYKIDLAACQTMPTIPRIVCVVVAKETLEECLNTAAAAAFGGHLNAIAPGGVFPQLTITDIEIVMLELVPLGVDSVEIAILPGNGFPSFPLPSFPTMDGFSFELNGADLALYFDDGFIVSVLGFDVNNDLVGGGAFVVTPAPSNAALFSLGCLVMLRRRRRA